MISLTSYLVWKSISCSRIAALSPNKVTSVVAKTAAFSWGFHKLSMSSFGGCNRLFVPRTMFKKSCCVVVISLLASSRSSVAMTFKHTIIYGSSKYAEGLNSRSEERRVGKECGIRWTRQQESEKVQQMNGKRDLVRSIHH